MKVLVTGGTGFIGRHVVHALLAKGHSVVVVARSELRVKELDWPDTVRFVACDIHNPELSIAESLSGFDGVIHLAWPGLPNYKSLIHLEVVFPAECRFLKALILSGCKNLVVAGTCFEYGIQNGCLREDIITNPENPYAIAKNSLRLYLQSLQAYESFSLKWARLFYTHGPGQNEKSLLSQLDLALERGDKEFQMSGGEQLRDYLPVDQLSAYLVALLESEVANGVINICSGQPISVRRLVETHLFSRGKSIELQFGHYPYPDFEPFAFWGCNRKFRELTK